MLAFRGDRYLSRAATLARCELQGVHECDEGNEDEPATGSQIQIRHPSDSSYRAIRRHIRVDELDHLGGSELWLKNIPMIQLLESEVTEMEPQRLWELVISAL